MWIYPRSVNIGKMGGLREMRKIVIDPVTRIEGHLKVETIVDGGEVKEARCSGMLFRGTFEISISSS